jgi:hypothetical protein
MVRFDVDVDSGGVVTSRVLISACGRYWCVLYYGNLFFLPAGKFARRGQIYPLVFGGIAIFTIDHY